MKKQVSARDDESVLGFGLRCITAAALALASLACSCTEAGQSGTEASNPSCNEQSGARAVSPTEVTSYGAPLDIAHTVSQRELREITYMKRPDESPIATMLELAVAAEPTTAKLMQWRTPGNAATICPDTVEMAASVGFRTADGAFEESFVGTLRTEEGSQRFVGTLTAEDLRGSYDMSWYPAKSKRIEVAVSFTAEGLSGSLTLVPSSSDNVTLGGADVLSW